MVAGIDLTQLLNLGDRIQIRGHTTNIEFTIDSMQVDNMDVTESAAGQSIGVKVSDRVRRGDRVYKVAD